MPVCIRLDCTITLSLPFEIRSERGGENVHAAPFNWILITEGFAEVDAGSSLANREREADAESESASRRGVLRGGECGELEVAAAEPEVGVLWMKEVEGR